MQICALRHIVYGENRNSNSQSLAGRLVLIHRRSKENLEVMLQIGGVANESETRHLTH